MFEVDMWHAGSQWLAPGAWKLSRDVQASHISNFQGASPGFEWHLQFLHAFWDVSSEGCPWSSVERATRAMRAMRGNALETTVSTVLWVQRRLPQSTVRQVVPGNESHESETGCSRTLATVLWVPLILRDSQTDSQPLWSSCSCRAACGLLRSQGSRRRSCRVQEPHCGHWTNLAQDKTHSGEEKSPHTDRTKHEERQRERERERVLMGGVRDRGRDRVCEGEREIGREGRGTEREIERERERDRERKREREAGRQTRQERNRDG